MTTTTSVSTNGQTFDDDEDGNVSGFEFMIVVTLFGVFISYRRIKKPGNN
ncbi:MAG: hypothetical protein ACXAC7_23400 [Candidatus Hodarchaeales archaeon]